HTTVFNAQGIFTCAEVIEPDVAHAHLSSVGIIFIQGNGGPLTQPAGKLHPNTACGRTMDIHVLDSRRGGDRIEGTYVHQTDATRTKAIHSTRTKEKQGIYSCWQVFNI